MRDCINIPARYGAEVFTNQLGGITIAQRAEDGDDQLVALSLDEALSVAAALREVVECVQASVNKGGASDDSKA